MEVMYYDRAAEKLFSTCDLGAVYESGIYRLVLRAKRVAACNRFT